MNPRILELAEEAGMFEGVLKNMERVGPLWCGEDVDLKRFYFLAQAEVLEELAHRVDNSAEILTDALANLLAQKRKEAE